MISRIDKFERQTMGTIKVGRYKTVKTVEKIPITTLFTKILTFPITQSLDWVTQELQDRVTTLENIHQIPPIAIGEKMILRAEVVQTTTQKILYLTNNLMPGWNLADILSKKDNLQDIFEPKRIKDIIWQIMGLLIVGKGFKNVIITNQNLFFQITGLEQHYKPIVNYLSFIGILFLKTHAKIDREQYAQIAMFLDQEALESGNLDRFEFKARNFACLMLSLLSQRNPYNFIFQGANVQPVVTIDQAKQFYRSLVKPRINQLLSYNTLKERINKLEIKGLQAFLKAAFDYPEDNLNWATVQANLLGDKFHEDSEFGKISKLLWGAESDSMKKLLIKQGLGCGQQGPQIYLAMKLSVNMQNLLKSNNWEKMINESEYNRMTREMFYRLLKFANFEDESYTQALYKIGNYIFESKHVLQNNPFITLPQERKILLQYPH